MTKRVVRKPRRDSLEFDFGRPVAPTSVRVTSEGEVSFLDSQGNPIPFARAKLETAYERKLKSPKVLTRAEFRPGDSPTLSLDSFLKGLTHLYAIDTNTRTIDGHQVSVAILIRVVRMRNGAIAAVPEFGIMFKDADVHPDLLAWSLLIDLNKTRPAGENWGLIVDSHLGQLSDLANRRAPVLDDVYFPPHFNLIFASDVANHGLANILLKQADRFANVVLRDLESNPDKLGGEWASHPHCAGLRRISTSVLTAEQRAAPLQRNAEL